MKKNDRGFTLVEVLVYMMLLGIVMTSIYAVFISNVKSHASQENAVEMVQDLRGSVDIMVREIRMAGCAPEGVLTGSRIGFTNDVVSGDAENNDTDADSIHFTMDINNDSDDPYPDKDAGDANEDITYYLDNASNTLKRRSSATGSFQPLAEKISGLEFKYYNASGTEVVNPATTTALDSIRTVLVTITGETDEKDPNTGQKKQRVISTRVRVRNAGL